MFTLFLCVALCADEPAGVQAEIPEQVREYFERADKIRADEVAVYQLETKRLETAIRVEGVPQEKSKLRRELARVAAHLADLKRTKPSAAMLGEPAVGDLGGFDVLTVHELRDDNTALVHVYGLNNRYQNTPPMSALISGPLAKSLKARQATRSPTVWIVTEIVPKDKKGTDGGSRQPSEVIKVDPMNKVDLEKYRAIYEAEKKQNVAPPAAIKDEKPELDKAPMPAKPKGNAAEK